MQMAAIGELQVRGVAVGLGVDRDDLDAQLLAGSDDSQCDLATIGHQDPLKHREPLSLAGCDRSGRDHPKQGLIELDGLAVLDEDLGDRARDTRRDIGEDFHGLDDADGGVRLDGGADRDEGRSVGALEA